MFVGMEVMLFNAKLGSNVAVGVSATITGGITVPDGRFVPPGSVITTQEQADALPERIGGPYEGTNEAILHVNQQPGEGYDRISLEERILLREKQMEEGCGRPQYRTRNGSCTRVRVRPESHLQIIRRC